MERPARRRRRLPRAAAPTTTRASSAPTTWRHVRFVELATPAAASSRRAAGPARDGRRRGHVDVFDLANFDSWVFMSDVCKHCTHAGCMDACPTGALIRSRVRHGRAAAGHLQRLRLLHPVVPVRRRRPRPRRRPRRQVHALLRPPAGRAGARVREGLPDGLDPVRRLRRARRRRRSAASPRCTSAASRAPTCTARRARGAGGRARRVLPAHPAAGALRPAGQRRLADPGRTSSPRRSPRSAPGCWPRRAWPRRSCGRRAGERRARHDPGRRLAGARRRSASARARRSAAARARLARRRAGRTCTARTRATRPRSREGAGRARPAGRSGRRDDEGAGVDVGGPAVLLDRRDRVGLGVRGAGLRPGGRPRLRPRGPAGLARRAGRLAAAARPGPRPPRALPATCCGSSRRARRCRWARGR